MVLFPDNKRIMKKKLCMQKRTRYIRKAARLLELLFLNILSLILPKDPWLLVFFSRPVYSGNAKALYDYLKKNYSGYRCLWLVSTVQEKEVLDKWGITAVNIRSLKGYLARARARVVFSTSSAMDIGFILFKKPLYVNLWHGFSPKGTGWLYRARSRNEIIRNLRFSTNNADLIIATSGLTRLILAGARGIPIERIVVTGHPRNDWLFSSKARENLSKLFALPSQAKVVLFAPTYRDVNFKSGLIKKSAHVASVVKSERFRQVLAAKNAVCIVKPHPYEETLWNRLEYELQPPLYFLSSSRLLEHGLDLFEILGAIDLFITDLSSIYIDLLLLNKPMIFYFPDMYSYIAERGLKLEPIEMWLPGPIVFQIDELIQELSHCLDHPHLYEAERIRVRKLLHAYVDSLSCERVWKAVQDLIRDNVGYHNG